MQKEAVGPSEAARLLGIGRNRMRAILASGELPAVRLGPRSIRIPVSALRAWLARAANSPKEAA